MTQGFAGASQVVVTVIVIPLFLLLAMIIGFSVPYFGIMLLNFLFGTSVVFAVWMHWVCMISFITGVLYSAIKMKGKP